MFNHRKVLQKRQIFRQTRRYFYNSFDIDIATKGFMMEHFNFHSTAEAVTEGLDFTGQTFVVTGSNSGLGKESIRVLAMRGASIIACARTITKAQDTITELGIDGIPVACDLANLQSVTLAVESIRALNIPIQCIIANAGIMALPTLHQVHGYEIQFFTNHVGHFHFVTGLVDSLTDNGRVVVLSSRAHAYARKYGMELDNLSGEHDYNDWRMYGRSKLANILFAKSLNKRFEGSNRRANSVHPGVIKTNLGRHVLDREGMYERIQRTIPLKNVPQGTSTQLLVATHPLLEGIGGHYFSDCQIAETIPQGEDESLAEELWGVTETIIAGILA